METPELTKRFKKLSYKLAIVFPNRYHGGLYSLALLIIYNLVNKLQNWSCDRVYLDHGNLKNYDLIGFSFQYELDYYNFTEILKRNNIPLSKDRKEIIFAGGPCINTNPNTLSKYIDFFILGEAEEILTKLLKLYDKDKSKFLKKISKIEGVYVPGLNKKSYHYNHDLDLLDYPLYQPLPNIMDQSFVFGKSFILEIERGCPFNCYFCNLPSFYSAVKKRSLENIKEIIDKGTKINQRKKVVIYSPSFTHPQRKEILNYLLSKGLEFSVPSLKVNLVDEVLLTLIKKGGQKTLTFAPECNESLRFKIGKKIKDEEFFKIVEIANKLKFKVIKYYFMIGLPEQTEGDMTEMIEFINELKYQFNGRTSVSINILVPKPKSKFENQGFDKKLIKKQMLYIKKNLKISYKMSNLSSSYKEWRLSHAQEF